MAGVSISPATPADLEALVALHVALWEGDPQEQRDELLLLLPRPTFAVFIARDAGEVLGFAEATLREYVDGADPGAPGAYLEGLFVAESARRSGVARALYKAVTAWAQTHGCRHIGSDADEENPEGIAWHTALGFEEVGRTVNFVRAI